MKQKVFALTGVTGHLGRHVFFEIIKDHLDNLDTLEIFILGRASYDQSLSERIEDILLNDGMDYLSMSPNNFPLILSFLRTNIRCINIDLSTDELINSTEYRKLVGKRIDYFLHIAASTDFRDNAKTREWLNRTNVIGTSKILELVSSLIVKEFGYVSTAYACGKTYGDVKPDYTNLDQEFRNPYEKSKLEGELLVRTFQQRTGIRCRIFRPSTICGRLIEQKKGAINKFDVFYSWAAFFLRWKIKQLNYTEDIYNIPLKVNLRIMVNKNAGLNIVPVDFAAKILYQICIQNIEGDYFHLVNEVETPHEFYIPRLLEVINLSGFSFVSSTPNNLSLLENFYYKTIGTIFEGYMIQNAIKFNTDNLQDLYKRLNLYCPSIDENDFNYLVQYAKSKNFGLQLTTKSEPVSFP
ncbi:Male sterility protein [Zobellia uliginosa]|uniref:Male sterility protein n=1 Tax=Zobellia uliginosa TaxID=143224 RepID=A0ABY1L215_9FLAO|nr:SDR family oxidoreductase [Zobellia uliginosa]SIT09741.1 Male sterility protein [Zobellia uliginosa]